MQLFWQYPLEIETTQLLCQLKINFIPNHDKYLLDKIKQKVQSGWKLCM